MSMTEIYVDPSIAADSGNGAIGTPFGDLEYAIEQTTFDTTNGTRINIKAGTAEFTAANLTTALADTSVSIAWVPVAGARLVIQGYTAAAGDGGRATLDLTTGLVLTTFGQYWYLVDLDIVNTTGQIIAAAKDFAITRCSVEGNATGKSLKLSGNSNTVHNNYFYGTGGANIIIDAVSGKVTNNYIVNAGTGPCIWVTTNGFAANNILVLSQAGSNGIYAPGADIVHNSIYNSTGVGTGQGIYGYSDSRMSNNLIEGFNGTGGRGIDSVATSNVAMDVSGNGFFNCETNIKNVGTANFLIASDNEALSESPFTNAASGDFSPVDTGNVKEGSLPGIIGAGLV